MSDGSIPGAAKLIAAWRERGLTMCPDIKPPYVGWTQQQFAERPLGAVLLQCADELEALVRSSLSQPEQEQDDEKTFARSHQHDDSGAATTEREK